MEDSNQMQFNQQNNNQFGEVNQEIHYNQSNNSKKRRNMLIVGPLLLLIALVGVTYAFFNYTRTGLANNIGTGKIYFYSNQGNALYLTNMFPMASSEVSNANLDSISINIVGDTTYADGEEFLISIVDVNNTIISGSTEKRIPINYIASYEITPVATGETPNIIGSSNNDYYNARNEKNANIYLLNSTGAVEENKKVLVGFIKSGNTGINGTLTIKAYLDADRIAISDTYNETSPETDTNGTTTEWVNGRTVLTTDEWNSIGTTPISFKIKAESNEGIWVGKIDTCPGCKFTFRMQEEDLLTTWNMDGWDSVNRIDIPDPPSVFTTDLYDSYYDIMEATGKEYFLGLVLNGNNEATNAYACGIKNNKPFCIEGWSDGSKYEYNKSLLQGVDLYNNSCEVIKYGTTKEWIETDCGLWDGNMSAWADDGGYVGVGTHHGHKCYVDGFYGHVGCRED